MPMVFISFQTVHLSFFLLWLSGGGPGLLVTTRCLFKLPPLVHHVPQGPLIIIKLSGLRLNNSKADMDAPSWSVAAARLIRLSWPDGN